MSQTGKTFESLRVQLTDEELLEHGKAAAKLSQELSAAEEEEKQVKADYKARKERIDANMRHHNRMVCNGYEYRQVECSVLMNTPRAGTKTIVRNDTGENVRTENMSAADTQSVLDFYDDAADLEEDSPGAADEIVHGEIVDDYSQLAALPAPDAE